MAPRSCPCLSFPRASINPAEPPGIPGQMGGRSPPEHHRQSPGGPYPHPFPCTPRGTQTAAGGDDGDPKPDRTPRVGETAWGSQRLPHRPPPGAPGGAHWGSPGPQNRAAPRGFGRSPRPARRGPDAAVLGPPPPQQIPSGSPVIPRGLGPPRAGCALPGRARGGRRRGPNGPARAPGGQEHRPPLPGAPGPRFPLPRVPGGTEPARPRAPTRRGLPRHRPRGPGAPGPAGPALRRRRGGPGPAASPVPGADTKGAGGRAPGPGRPGREEAAARPGRGGAARGRTRGLSPFRGRGARARTRGSPGGPAPPTPRAALTPAAALRRRASGRGADGAPRRGHFQRKVGPAARPRPAPSARPPRRGRRAAPWGPRPGGAAPALLGGRGSGGGRRCAAGAAATGGVTARAAAHAAGRDPSATLNPAGAGAGGAHVGTAGRNRERRRLRPLPPAGPGRPRWPPGAHPVAPWAPPYPSRLPPCAPRPPGTAAPAACGRSRYRAPGRPLTCPPCTPWTPSPKWGHTRADSPEQVTRAPGGTAAPGSGQPAWPGPCGAAPGTPLLRGGGGKVVTHPRSLPGTPAPGPPAGPGQPRVGRDTGGTDHWLQHPRFHCPHPRGIEQPPPTPHFPPQQLLSNNVIE